MSNFASGYVKYINHLEQINDAAVSDPARMIDEVEDAYHDHLENIARNITSHHQGVRVVMLSGPSSSGKTTTAHLLRDYLTQYGAKSYIVSLDDFYRGVGLAPRLPTGSTTTSRWRPWTWRPSSSACWILSPPAASPCPATTSPWAAPPASPARTSWGRGTSSLWRASTA